jgi:hypothetical protein
LHSITSDEQDAQDEGFAAQDAACWTGKVLKRLHYPLDVIVLCVRWNVAYSLSLRNLEEMMAERGIEVERSTFEFRRVVEMQDAGNASHGPVRFYSYLLKPWCLRQHDPCKKQTDRRCARSLHSQIEAQHAPRCNVKCQREPRPTNDLAVQLVHQQYVGLRVIDLDDV